MGVPAELVGPQPRLLVVDDDPEHVAAVRSYVAVARPDIEVEVAFDGFSGGLLVAQHWPQLILLDMAMPGLSGEDVCARIRASRELDASAVVVVSGVLGPSLIARLRALGADACLPKPLEPPQLDALLERFLPAPETPSAHPDPR